MSKYYFSFIFFSRINKIKNRNVLGETLISETDSVTKILN